MYNNISLNVCYRPSFSNAPRIVIVRLSMKGGQCIVETIIHGIATVQVSRTLFVSFMSQELQQQQKIENLVYTTETHECSHI